MAESPVPKLGFPPDQCPDCGGREITLPLPVPELGDDFDWGARDYDGFRLSMLEDLAARFPERTRWTAADQEVIVVEVLAWALDHLSDMLDRVITEATLETARRAESVSSLLSLIGYPLPEDKTLEPADLDVVRREGPRSVHRQRRMVTVDDYALRMEEHPLVLRAEATTQWNGSWEVIRIAVILKESHQKLDEKLILSNGSSNSSPNRLSDKLSKSLETFRKENGDLPAGNCFRDELNAWIEARRMAGQEVRLENPIWVGIVVNVTARIGETYFQREVKRALEEVLGTKPGGFFEVNSLRFGEDLYASDIVQAAMQVDGVDAICISDFRRVGYPDQRLVEVIELQGLEVGVCDNLTGKPESGWLQIQCIGGRKG